MSMKFRDKDGNETLIAGMGRSGELVPSDSYYQSGTTSVAVTALDTVCSVAVTFSTPMPDTDYVVNLESGAGNAFCRVSGKTTSGFNIDMYKAAGGTGSVSVSWHAFKLMTDESRALDEAQIEENKTNIASLTEGIPLQTPPSSDCNELIGVSGKRVCYLNNNTITSNSPVAAYGVLIVDRYDVRTYQKYVSTSASDGYVEYTRMSARNTSSSSWTAWVKTARENVTSGTATRASSATDGTCKWTKIGCIVDVIINQLILPVGATINTVCFTGLPASTLGGTAVLYDVNNDKSILLDIGSTVSLGGRGNLGNLATNIWGRYTYISKD